MGGRESERKKDTNECFREFPMDMVIDAAADREREENSETGGGRNEI
jgi:hypothetical protein